MLGLLLRIAIHPQRRCRHHDDDDGQHDRRACRIARGNVNVHRFSFLMTTVIAGDRRIIAALGRARNWPTQRSSS